MKRNFQFSALEGGGKIALPREKLTLLTKDGADLRVCEIQPEPTTSRNKTSKGIISHIGLNNYPIINKVSTRYKVSML